MPEDVAGPEGLFRGFPQGLAICRAVQDAVSRGTSFGDRMLEATEALGLTGDGPHVDRGPDGPGPGARER